MDPAGHYGASSQPSRSGRASAAARRNAPADEVTLARWLRAGAVEFAAILLRWPNDPADQSPACQCASPAKFQPLRSLLCEPSLDEVFFKAQPLPAHLC